MLYNSDHASMSSVLCVFAALLVFVMRMVYISVEHNHNTFDS